MNTNVANRINALMGLPSQRARRERVWYRDPSLPGNPYVFELWERPYGGRERDWKLINRTWSQPW